MKGKAVHARYEQAAKYYNPRNFTMPREDVISPPNVQWVGEFETCEICELPFGKRKQRRTRDGAIVHKNCRTQ